MDDVLSRLEVAEGNVTSVAEVLSQCRQLLREQQTRIDTLESKNRALHKALKVMKSQREKDKLTILGWQEFLKAQDVQNMLTNQSKSEAATDVVVDSELTQDGSSQVPLDEHINLHESNESHGKPSNQNSGFVNNYAPFKQHISQSLLSQNSIWNSNHIPVSSQGQLFNAPGIQWDSDSPEEHSDRKIYSDAELENQSQEQKPSDDNSNDKPAVRLSQDVFINDIVHRNWHPADFKLNEDYTSFTRLKKLELLNRIRDKESRKCMHGSDCKDCAKFYELLGTDVAIQLGSRHRHIDSDQETPIGFWRADFPNSDERRVDNEAESEALTKEANKRLNEALMNGKYVFKNPELREAITKYIGD